MCGICQDYTWCRPSWLGPSGSAPRKCVIMTVCSTPARGIDTGGVSGLSRYWPRFEWFRSVNTKPWKPNQSFRWGYTSTSVAWDGFCHRQYLWRPVGPVTSQREPALKTWRSHSVHARLLPHLLSARHWACALPPEKLLLPGLGPGPPQPLQHPLSQ